MAEDAAAVLAAEGIKNAHVMGFSMGGHIAQCVALNHPSLVRSLGIHHSWSRNCNRLHKFQSLRKTLAERGLREQLADISLLMLYEPQYYHDHLDDMAAKRDAMIASMATMEGWIGQLEACIKRRYPRTPGGIGCPDAYYLFGQRCHCRCSPRSGAAGWHSKLRAENSSRLGACGVDRNARSICKNLCRFSGPAPLTPGYSTLSVHRSAATSSEARASTHFSPSPVSSFFQNGARVFK